MNKKKDWKPDVLVVKKKKFKLTKDNEEDWKFEVNKGEDKKDEAG